MWGINTNLQTPCPRLKTSLVQSKLPTPGVEWCIQVSMFIRASATFSQGEWNTDEMKTLDVLLIVSCALYINTRETWCYFGCTQHDNYSTCAAAESKNCTEVVQSHKNFVVSTEASCFYSSHCVVFYSSSSLSSSLVFLSLLMLKKSIRSCSGFFLFFVKCSVPRCCLREPRRSCARKKLRYSPGETQQQAKTKALVLNQSS